MVFRWGFIFLHKLSSIQLAFTGAVKREGRERERETLEKKMFPSLPRKYFFHATLGKILLQCCKLENKSGISKAEKLVEEKLPNQKLNSEHQRLVGHSVA